MDKLAGILFGLLLVAIAIVGFKRRRAFFLGFRVEQQKEPVGFWLAIFMQSFMGLFAVIYSLVR